MSKNVQISIYRLDTKSILSDVNWELAKEKKEKLKTLELDKLVELFLDGKYLKSKQGKKYRNVQISEKFQSHEKCRLIYGYLSSRPNWEGFVSSIINENDHSIITDNNKQKSFCLFVSIESRIYAATGGNGYFLIKSYIDETFGISVAEEIISSEKSTVKLLQDRSVIGEVLEQQRIFRGNLKIEDEDSYGKIYKKVLSAVNANDLIVMFPDIISKDDIKPKTNILAKDSFRLFKSISSETLIKLVTKLDKLSSSKNSNLKFSKIVLVDQGTKRGKETENILNHKLVNKIIDDLYNKRASNGIDFVPCDISNYIEASTIHIEYRGTALVNLEDNDGSHNYERILRELINCREFMADISQTFTERDIGEKDKNDKLIKFFSDIKISALDDENSFKTGFHLFKALDSEMDIEQSKGMREHFFRVEGKWYKIEEELLNSINSRLISLSESRQINNILPIAWDNDKNVGENYFIESKLIQKIDKDNLTLHKFLCYPQNIEFCDVMCLRGDEIYLVHIKDGFDGKARELCGQIYVCAKFLEKDLNSDCSLLKKYYDTVSKRQAGDKYFIKSKENFINSFPTVEKFVNVFVNAKKIYIVYAFRHKYSLTNTNLIKFDSNIAKITLIDLDRSIRSQTNHKIELKIMQLNNV